MNIYDETHDMRGVGDKRKEFIKLICLVALTSDYEVTVAGYDTVLIAYNEYFLLDRCADAKEAKGKVKKYNKWINKARG